MEINKKSAQRPVEDIFGFWDLAAIFSQTWGIQSVFLGDLLFFQNLKNTGVQFSVFAKATCIS